jgi:hypothetical protein
MPARPTATANYCEHYGTSVNLEAKYFQTCGKILLSNGISRDEAATREKDTDLIARLSILETKIEELKQLIFPHDSSASDEIVS